MTRRTTRRKPAPRQERKGPQARGRRQPTAVPDPLQLLFLEAVRAHKSGNLEEAQKRCLEILSRDVRHADALHMLGLVLYAEGRPETAAGMMRRAIAINDRESAYYSNLGNALHAMGKLDEALDAYNGAIELKPGFADAHYNLANTLRDMNRLDQSIVAYKCALQLKPEYAEAHCNLGGVLRNRGRLEEAEKHLREGMRLRPDYADATNNLAITLQDQGRLDEALECFERAVELMPENYDVRYNKAMAHLLAADFDNGWHEQEARWKIKNAPRMMEKPQWMGEPLHGQRLLLHHECGFGDTIQFLRYVPMAAKRGATVIVDVPQNLIRLARLIPGVAAVSVTGGPLPEFDLHCPMLSLPLAFHTDLNSIPGDTPYLSIPSEAKEKAATLDWPTHGLRVGLVWTGNPAFSRDQFRSIPLEQLSSLFSVEGVHFYSLQIGPGSSQWEAYRSHVADLTPHIKDMADTAALLTQLDLLISVDTSVAHLAGALAVPVWTLIPAAPDWRWLTERKDTPWYPSMRLFRQQKLAEWGPVVERIRLSLAASQRRAEEMMAQAS